MSLYGLPQVTPAAFTWTPLVYAMLGPLLAGLLWLSIGDRAALIVAIATCAIGFLGGLYVKYRSRFVARHAWVMQWVLALWMAGFASAAVMLAYRLGVGQPSPAIALALLMLALAAAGTAGFLTARRKLPAPDNISSTSLLHGYADMQRLVLRADGRASAGGQINTGGTAWAAALGVNIPLLAALCGFEGVGLMGLVAGAMAVLAGWMLWAKVGPGLAIYGALLRIERLQGKRFESDQHAAIAALRRQAWGARWLCRADDFVAALYPRKPSRRRSPPR